MSTTPKLSVVIASINGAASLADCLASIAAQPLAEHAEVVVAESSADEAARRVCAQFANVRSFHFAERKTIPELRAIGLLNARGDVLAMTEDHCFADAHWIEHLLRAHESPHEVIGGVVENAATTRLIDWAVYFCEYGRYMQPVAAGPTDDLPGPNVSYKRAALERFRDLLAPATWEPFWHWRLMSEGVQLVNDPSVVMYHRKHFTFRGFMSERYHYARSFAGRRVEGAARVKRTAYAFGAPLLPPLLLGRIVSRVLRKRRKRRELLFSLPYIVLFTLSWSWGELIGYTWGAGESLEQIS
ncbi:MAG: glycosyltransferase [Chloroflexi bacterium]|nr:glycosyltransferase [Chloroflexota bacterium]